MRRVLPLVLLLAGAGGAYALYRTKPQPQPLESQERAWIVDVADLDTGVLSPELQLYGRVVSPRVAALSAAVEADVVEVPVLEGQRVEADALTVRLDDQEVRLELEQRRAELAGVEAEMATQNERHRNDRRSLDHEHTLLELTRKEVERMEELAETQVGSRSQLDQARQLEERQALAVAQRDLAIRQHTSHMARLEAERNRALALIRRAELDLERTRVNAPFRGRVSRVHVSPGDRVRVGDPLIGVYDTASLEIRAQIPTRHLMVVRGNLESGPGLQARATVDGREVTAMLDRLSGEVARRSGGADAFLRITSAGEWLELGRTVAMTLELPPEEDVAALPLEAIYAGKRIYVLEGERMRALEVERVGEIRGPGGSTLALVRGAGIATGQQVVVTQLPNAIDGLRVKVAE